MKYRVVKYQERFYPEYKQWIFPWSGYYIDPEYKNRLWYSNLEDAINSFSEDEKVVVWQA